ncbi:MAG: hypothetical protein M4579_004189 [Chaenotheca gracillima]|nr:MAG: hypothetical protein M4579_004189 [Chaenotheca gracillima]
MPSLRNISVQVKAGNGLGIKEWGTRRLTGGRNVTTFIEAAAGVGFTVHVTPAVSGGVSMGYQLLASVFVDGREQADAIKLVYMDPELQREHGASCQFVGRAVQGADGETFVRPWKFVGEVGVEGAFNKLAIGEEDSLMSAMGAMSVARGGENEKAVGLGQIVVKFRRVRLLEDRYEGPVIPELMWLEFLTPATRSEFGARAGALCARYDEEEYARFTFLYRTQEQLRKFNFRGFPRPPKKDEQELPKGKKSRSVAGFPALKPLPALAANKNVEENPFAPKSEKWKSTRFPTKFDFGTIGQDIELAAAELQEYRVAKGAAQDAEIEKRAESVEIDELRPFYTISSAPADLDRSPSEDRASGTSTSSEGTIAGIPNPIQYSNGLNVPHPSIENGAHPISASTARLRRYTMTVTAPFFEQRAQSTADAALHKQALDSALPDSCSESGSDTEEDSSKENTLPENLTKITLGKRSRDYSSPPPPKRHITRSGQYTCDSDYDTDVGVEDNDSHMVSVALRIARKMSAPRAGGSLGRRRSRETESPTRGIMKKASTASPDPGRSTKRARFVDTETDAVLPSFAEARTCEMEG